MRRSQFRRAWLAIIFLTAAVVITWAASWSVLAQVPDDSGQRDRRGRGYGYRFMRGRDPGDRGGVPEWTIDPDFRKDVFTFTRVIYQSRGRGGWAVDYPNADLNLSYRLQQLTSMKVDPNAFELALDDPRLPNYPFLFMIDPRSIILSQEEAAILRRYLLNGGFLMVDDFWGDQMWNHLMGELAKVFPDRTPVSLPLDHPIFNIPFPLKVKPQVPSEDSAHRQQNNPDPRRRTWEDEISWEEPQPADYRAFLDDKGRIMLLICWNTDLSDGWEEEGVSKWFFENFSEKSSYPMAINILFYVLTH